MSATATSLRQVGGRTLIAKTCNRCGLLLPGDQFLPSGKRNKDGSRSGRRSICKRCLNKIRVEWRKSHPEQVNAKARRYRQKAPDKVYSFRRRYQARTNSLTLETATRRGQEWTGPEMEIIARPGLTDRQRAALLGRTFYAVQQQRRLLQIDPRKQRLAGIA